MKEDTITLRDAHIHGKVQVAGGAVKKKVEEKDLRNLQSKLISQDAEMETQSGLEMAGLMLKSSKASTDESAFSMGTDGSGSVAMMVGSVKGFVEEVELEKAQKENAKKTDDGNDGKESTTASSKAESEAGQANPEKPVKKRRMWLARDEKVSKAATDHKLWLEQTMLKCSNAKKSAEDRLQTLGFLGLPVCLLTSTRCACFLLHVRIWHSHVLS